MSARTKSTHTPGPWKAEEWAIHAPTAIRAGNVTIAECSGYGRHSDESLGDARLIAAAPEMLEALRLVAPLGDSSVAADLRAVLRPHERPAFERMIDAVRAAIAKAMGEAS